MRIMHVPFLGFFGGMGLSWLGLWPLLDSISFSDSGVQSVRISKPIVNKKVTNQTRTEPFRRFENDATVDRDSTTSSTSAEAILRRKVELLEQGKKFLNGIDGYTGQLRKRELVNDVLRDEQTIFVKCRHKPFSVYLRWVEGDVGREVIYVDGQNDGKLIAHDGGWKSRIPAISLAPDCPLAMIDSRQPVTSAGLLNFVETMLKVHQDDLSRSNLQSCNVDSDGSFEGRACHVFTTSYQSAVASPECRKNVTMIDKEWNIPIHFENFEWAKREITSSEEQLDEATLIESYSFTEFDFETQLNDHDFDRTNQEYRFR